MPADKKADLSPKPYFFVSQGAAAKRDKLVGTEQYGAQSYTGRLMGTIRAVTQLHIGSGCLEFGDALGIRGSEVPQLAYDTVKSRGTVYIPGSSLKGCVRSVVEAITASCVSKTKQSVGDGYRECKVRMGHADSTLCPACRLFGAMGVISRITFADAMLEKGEREFVKLPSLYQPRIPGGEFERPARKFYFHHGSISKGSTPYEVCKADSEFSMQISFSNLSPPELGLLCQSLGVGKETFNLKIGKGRPVGLGSIQIFITTLELLTPSSYKSWGEQSFSRFSGDELASKLQALTSDLGSLVESKQFAAFLAAVRKVEPPPVAMY